jgi:hypothetical protein
MISSAQRVMLRVTPCLAASSRVRGGKQRSGEGIARL